MSLINIPDFDSSYSPQNEKKYKGVNLAFNRNGEFNKHLDEDEMIKFYQDVVDNKMKIPEKSKTPIKKIEVENGEDSQNKLE